jgi:catechol 2,3-dioxygenase-like lactoylglutathione lyase family enzyme
MVGEELRMIRGVKFVSIPVRDQEASLSFYTEKLGFRVLTDQPFDGKQRWIELGIARSDTRVVLFTMDGQEARIGGLSNVTFVADDVQKTYEELHAKGVEFVRAPEPADWGSAAVFRDLDGNQFVLSSK